MDFIGIIVIATFVVAVISLVIIYLTYLESRKGNKFAEDEADLAHGQKLKILNHKYVIKEVPCIFEFEVINNNTIRTFYVRSNEKGELICEGKRYDIFNSTHFPYASTSDSTVEIKPNRPIWMRYKLTVTPEVRDRIRGKRVSVNLLEGNETISLEYSFVLEKESKAE